MVDYSKTYAALRRQCYIVEKGIAYQLHPNSIGHLAGYLSDFTDGMADDKATRLIDLYLAGVDEGTRRYEAYIYTDDGSDEETLAKARLDEFMSAFSEQMSEFVRGDGRVVILLGDYDGAPSRRTH